MTRPTTAATWQPIETAPRDGTKVITFDPEWGMRMDWFDRLDCVSGWLGEPTHWQPLPPPPVRATGATCKKCLHVQRGQTDLLNARSTAMASIIRATSGASRIW